MVGRLVEDQQVDAAGLQEREGGAGALAGRLRRRRPVDVVAAEPELGQQRADVGRGPVGDLARERVDQRLVALERARAPGRPRRRARRSRGRPRPTSAAAGPAAAPSRVDLPDAVRAGDRHAVAPVELEVDGAEREVAARHDRVPGDRDDRAGPAGGRDRHLQLPLLARLLDDVEPLDHLVGLPGLGRLLLRRLAAVVLDVLVVVGRLATRVPDALLHPRPLHARAGVERVAPGGVPLVRLAGLATGDRALVQVGVVAAAVGGDALQAAVDLDDGRHRAAEELAVVADDDDRRLASGRRTPPAGRGRRRRGRWSARRAGRGRSARAAARPGRPGRPGRRTARSSGGRGRPSGRGRRPPCRGAPRGRRRRARASVRAPRSRRRRRPSSPAPSASAAGSRAICAGVTPVRRPRWSRTDSPSSARSPAPGSPAARARARPRRCRCRAGATAAEDLQQRGLAGAVGADEADDVAGRDDEVDTGEQLAIAEPGPHVLGLDGCGHAVISPAPDGHRRLATRRTAKIRRRNRAAAQPRVDRPGPVQLRPTADRAPRAARRRAGWSGGR